MWVGGWYIHSYIYIYIDIDILYVWYIGGDSVQLQIMSTSVARI